MSKKAATEGGDKMRPSTGPRATAPPYKKEKEKFNGECGRGPDPQEPAFPKSEEEMQIVPTAWLMGWGFLAKGDFRKGT